MQAQKCSFRLEGTVPVAKYMSEDSSLLGLHPLDIKSDRVIVDRTAFKDEYGSVWNTALK